MPTFEQAQNIILGAVRPLETVTRALLDAVSMVAGETVLSGWDLPTLLPVRFQGRLSAFRGERRRLDDIRNNLSLKRKAVIIAS